MDTLRETDGDHFGDAKAMVEYATARRALTINHEYRYMPTFPVANGFSMVAVLASWSRLRLLQQPVRHGDSLLRLMLWYNNQEPVEWVIGGFTRSADDASLVPSRARVSLLQVAKRRSWYDDHRIRS